MNLRASVYKADDGGTAIAAHPDVQPFWPKLESGYSPEIPDIMLFAGH